MFTDFFTFELLTKILNKDEIIPAPQSDIIHTLKFSIYHFPINSIIPVEITRTKVIKNKTIFINETVDERPSKTSVIESVFNNDDIAEQRERKKYHTRSSIITGRFINNITIMIRTPKVLFIIKKLLITDDIASLTVPPTTGMKVPEINLIPFNIKVSDEDAKMLCDVRSPVNIVENKANTTITNFLNVLFILKWKLSDENEDIMLNENKTLITGINTLSAKKPIIFEKIIENELYVTAKDGFLDATIIPAIIGK